MSLKLNAYATQCDILCMMKIVLVSVLPDCHGCSCETHPYRCGNAFIKSAGNGAGRLVHLRLVEKTNLAEMTELMTVAYA
jgi:hypothetical protein